MNFGPPVSISLDDVLGYASFRNDEKGRLFRRVHWEAQGVALSYEKVEADGRDERSDVLDERSDVLAGLCVGPLWASMVSFSWVGCLLVF